MSEEISLDKVRDACKKSLHFLCTQMLKYQDWDKVHDDAEKFLVRPAMKKALLLPRDHLKTSMVTIGKSIQFILQNPNVRILIANQIWDFARKILAEIKGHLEDKSQLPELFGPFVSHSWTSDSIIVRQRTKSLKEPTIMTTGIEAENTGGHYEKIFLDDLMGHQNSATVDQRDKAKRFRRSMIALLEPGGEIIDIGTRWHNDDTFSEIFANEMDYYDVMVRKIVEKGQLIFPKKFSKKFDSVKKNWVHVDYNCLDYVTHLRKSMTSSEFSSQYLNEPIDDENLIFKPSYFRYYQRRPERLFTAMTIDPAISEKQSADYFAIRVDGMDEHYNIYVLDYIRGHWKVAESIDNIFTTYLKWRPSAVGLETVAYQKALKGWLEEKMRDRHLHFPITELRRGTNETKEFRIKAMEPFYREGKWFHAEWMKGKDLEQELLQFPKGKHDDLIDAGSGMLELLVPGDSERADNIPDGCWESAFQEARKFHEVNQSFFHETVLGQEPHTRPEGKSFWDQVNP